MNRKKKWLIITLLSISFILHGSVQVQSDEENLVIRVVDASFPPETSIFEDENYSAFGFDISLQIENPTSSDIIVYYACGPYPFPYLEANLVDDSLEAELLFIIEWVEGSYSITPGIHDDFYRFVIIVDQYVNEYPPLGEYIIWFDYTNCSYVTVPVIIEKMRIYVLESRIVYIYEHNNETEIFFIPTTTSTPTPTSTQTQDTNKTSQVTSAVFFTLVLISATYKLYKQKMKL